MYDFEDFSGFPWDDLTARLGDAADEFIRPVHPIEPWSLASGSLAVYIEDELADRPTPELLDACSLLHLLESLHVPLDIWASPAHADPTFELLGFVLEFTAEVELRGGRRVSETYDAERYREQLERSFTAVIERRLSGAEFDRGMNQCVLWIRDLILLPFHLGPRSDDVYWPVRDGLNSLANAAEALRDAFRVQWWRHELKSTEIEINRVSRIAEHGWRRSKIRDLGPKELAEFGDESWDLGGG